MYGFGKFLHYVPFKLKLNSTSYDLLSPQNLIVYKSLGIYSFLVQISIIVYLYTEAFLGQTSEIELYLITGCNSIFIFMCASQFYHLFSPFRRGLLNIMGFVLEEKLKNSHIRQDRHELLYLLFSSCSILYPFLYFPAVILFFLVVPNAVRSILDGTHFIALSIGGNDAEILEKCLRYGVCAIFAVALGQSVFNGFSTVLFILEFQVYVGESLEAMLSNRYWL